LFLDETLFNCTPIHDALRELSVEFVRHDQKFEAGTIDQEWLPIVGQQRLIVLTSDKRIRFNELEREQVISFGVREFVFSSGNLSGRAMGEILKTAMAKMKEIVSETAAPFIACITQSGNVEVRYDSQGSVHRRKRNEKGG
jgi:hypothetical protein